jgi:serine/threonine protein kinase
MTLAVRWMAPEMACGAVPLPILGSDVFSLGRTMLEIFTGEKPFPKKKNAFALLGQLNNGTLTVERPAKLEVVDRGLTDDVWALMNEMWEWDVEKRPNMNEVERRLELLM